MGNDCDTCYQKDTSYQAEVKRSTEDKANNNKIHLSGENHFFNPGQEDGGVGDRELGRNLDLNARANNPTQNASTKAGNTTDDPSQRFRSDLQGSLFQSSKDGWQKIHWDDGAVYEGELKNSLMEGEVKLGSDRASTAGPMAINITGSGSKARETASECLNSMGTGNTPDSSKETRSKASGSKLWFMLQTREEWVFDL